MIRKSIFLLLVFGLIFIGLAVADNVDELITKNIQARGGMDKLKAVQSMKIVGKGMGQGMEYPLVLLKKRPNQLRIDITIQGMNLVQAYDGQTPWMVIPFAGNKDPQKMPDFEAKLFIEQADFDGPLVDYKEKGNTVEFVGQEDVEGTPANKLKVTLKNGEVRYFYLDAENNLEMKVTAVIKREGSERTVESYFSDYKEVDGLMIPHAIENRIPGGQTEQYLVEKVELNTTIDDAQFKMPEVTATQSQPSTK